MKLKYIFLAILGAATMGACSDSDIPTPNPEGDAMVALSMGVDNGAIITKADGDMQDLNGIAGEAQINRLTIFLFKLDGTVAAKKDTVDVVETPTILLNRIGNVIVAKGTYDILIVANADADLLNITSKAELAAYQGKLTSQNQVVLTASSNMLMASKYYEDVELVSLGNASNEPLRLTYNYFGEKESAKNIEADADQRTTVWYTESSAIPLTRLAARVQVRSVDVDLQEDLDGGSFKLDSIYIVNVRPTTHLIPNAGGYFEAVPATIPLYYRGAPAIVNVVDHLIYPADGAVPANNIFVQQFGFGVDNLIKDSNTSPYIFGKMPFWYVFENITSAEAPNFYNTRVVISGRIVTPAGVEKPRSYYSILIQKTGTDGHLVVRNKIYQIDAVIKGLGTDNPDKIMENAMISATVTADPWKIVIHEEDIED